MTVLAGTIITWARRLLKTPNTQDISDATMLDYLNRFYVYDVPYQLQVFDLRTTYSFETIPNIDRYNVPIETYNALLTPATCDGTSLIMTQSTAQLINLFPYSVYNVNSDIADGTAGPYSFTLANVPFIRGHTDVLGTLSPGVYITCENVAGTTLVVTDDGVGGLTGDGSGTVNYLTGDIVVTFNSLAASGGNIRTQTLPYTAGRPTVVLYYNNTITCRTVPDRSYLISFDAYLTPSAFLNTSSALQFSWMADYLAHGLARRVMKDLGDAEQLAFYEPFFKEQENQVFRRTLRQNNNVRVGTIFAGQLSAYSGNQFNY